MKNYVHWSVLFIGLILALILIAETGAQTKQELHNQLQPPAGTALFAGGCFWCMEKPFESQVGVHSAISGYAGGNTKNPTYKNYARGGHIEVVKIVYDPEQITYRELLDIFWKQINPTDDGGQFVDRGHEYSSAIFYYDEEQRALAERSKTQLSAAGIFDKPIVTPILPAPDFWPAEDYHQDYYKKNGFRYKIYRGGSGRDSFLKSVWKNKDFKTVK